MFFAKIKDAWFGRVSERMKGKAGKDYLFIFISSVITALAGLFLLKFIQYKFTEQEFEDVVLIFRYAGTAVAFLVMGMGVAVPRYIGFIDSRKKELDELSRIIGTALIVIVTAVSIFFMFSWFLYDYLDEALFGGRNVYYYASIYFAAMAMYGFSYSILRGREYFNIASTMEIVARAILPFLILWFASDAYKYLSIQSIAASIIAFWIVLGNIKEKDIKFNKEVCYFGLQRVFGDVLYPLLLTFPVICALHMKGSAEAAKLSIGFMVLTVFVMPVSPISVLILPKVGKVFEPSVDGGERLNKFLKYSFLAASALLAMYLIIGQVVWGLFGYSVDGTFLLLGGILYLNIIYVTTRSVIDGLFSKPYIFWFLMVALLVETIGLGWVFWLGEAKLILIPVVVAFMFLAGQVSYKLKRYGYLLRQGVQE